MRILKKYQRNLGLINPQVVSEHAALWHLGSPDAATPRIYRFRVSQSSWQLTS